MPKLSRSVIEADGTTGECGKVNCCTDSRTLHRHHRKHQAIWIGVWGIRRRNEEKFEEFVARYHQFHKDDWTRLCANHHAEIHMIYDQIIKRDRLKVGRSLSKYSWAQAEKLMNKLEAVCVEWLKKDTPGVTTQRLEELRKRYYNRPRRSNRSGLYYYIND